MLAELTARNALSKLNDPRLFREQAYVGGKWTAAADGKVIRGHQPRDRRSSSASCRRSAPPRPRPRSAAAAAAFPAWRRLLPQQRALRICAAGTS